MTTTAISTVRVGARQIARPGAVSQTDTSGAENAQITGGGRIAIVGESNTGRPQYAQVFTSLSALRKSFWLPRTDGGFGIREAANLAYSAANDSNVNGKPESICVVKVNRDTQATGVLQGAAGALINLTSEDYGTHTNRIRVTVGAGTLGGVLLTIRELDVIETGDNIGKDAALSIEYTGEASTADVDIDANGLQINYTKNDAGENGGEVTAGWTSGTPRIKSSSADDNFQSVTLYGLDGLSAPISETKTLNGTTYVDFAGTFAVLTGAHVLGLSAGAVTVEDGADVVKVTHAASLLAAVTPGTLRVVSGNTADVGLIVQLTGKNASGDDVVENLSLNGTTLVTGSESFSKLTRVSISGTTAGTVTVSDSAASLVTISAGTNASAGFFNTKGLYLPQTLPSASELTVTGGGAYDIVVRGVDDTGATVAERLTDAGGAATVTVAVLTSISQIELGATSSAFALAFYGEMVDVPSTDSVADVVDFLNDTGAFTAISYQDDRLLSEMDRVSTVSCLTPTVASLYSRASDVVDWISTNSALVTAERVSGASGLPVITSAPVPMAGATSPTPTVADWTAAIALLREQEVDFVVALTTSAAVRAYGLEHCQWADGVKEREFFAPLPQNSTIDEIDAATAALNSQWVSVFDDSWQAYDEAGVLRTYSPIATACAAAGMRASIAIGEPMTRKYVSAKAVGNTQRSSLDDGEALLRRGLCFLEDVPGKGIRWVRSITSYRRRANLVWTEQSANESFAKSIQDVRTFVDDTVIGTTTIRPPLEVIKADVIARLNFQRDTAKIITDFANVTVVEIGDLINIDYDCVPIFPRNFALITAHASIAVIPQTAAA